MTKQFNYGFKNEKGYTFMAPVVVPIASKLRPGSQASPVGLFGNPCWIVWNKIKNNYDVF